MSFLCLVNKFVKLFCFSVATLWKYVFRATLYFYWIACNLFLMNFLYILSFLLSSLLRSLVNSLFGKVLFSFFFSGKCELNKLEYCCIKESIALSALVWCSILDGSISLRASLNRVQIRLEKLRVLGKAVLILIILVLWITGKWSAIL